MRTPDLWKMGSTYVPNFIGVFPLNKIPQGLRAPANFIVNTDTHNLPGEHWLAVSYQKGGIVLAFDPFGIFYPRLLKIKLNQLNRTRPVHYSKIEYQSLFEQTCGLYCIAWLISVNKSKNSNKRV